MNESDFDGWMTSRNTKYLPSDDTEKLRELRACWEAAKWSVVMTVHTCNDWCEKTDACRERTRLRRELIKTLAALHDIADHAAGWPAHRAREALQ